jgi:hypothetical protein
MAAHLYFDSTHCQRDKLSTYTGLKDNHTHLQIISLQASKQASKQANKQASKQTNKQTNKQRGRSYVRSTRFGKERQ